MGYTCTRKKLLKDSCNLHLNFVLYLTTLGGVHKIIIYKMYIFKSSVILLLVFHHILSLLNTARVYKIKKNDYYFVTHFFQLGGICSSYMFIHIKHCMKADSFYLLQETSSLCNHWTTVSSGVRRRELMSVRTIGWGSRLVKQVAPAAPAGPPGIQAVHRLPGEVMVICDKRAAGGRHTEPCCLRAFLVATPSRSTKPPWIYPTINSVQYGNTSAWWHLSRLFTLGIRPLLYKWCLSFHAGRIRWNHQCKDAKAYLKTASRYNNHCSHQTVYQGPIYEYPFPSLLVSFLLEEILPN